MNRLFPKELTDALEETGKPHEIQKGKKHWKIVVDGVLVGIWPLNGDREAGSRRSKNVIAQIRRAV